MNSSSSLLISSKEDRKNNDEDNVDSSSGYLTTEVRYEYIVISSDSIRSIIIKAKSAARHTIVRGFVYDNIFNQVIDLQIDAIIVNDDDRLLTYCNPNIADSCYLIHVPITIQHDTSLSVNDVRYFVLKNCDKVGATMGLSPKVQYIGHRIFAWNLDIRLTGGDGYDKDNTILTPADLKLFEWSFEDFLSSQFKKVEDLSDSLVVHIWSTYIIKHSDQRAHEESDVSRSLFRSLSNVNNNMLEIEIGVIGEYYYVGLELVRFSSLFKIIHSETEKFTNILKQHDTYDFVISTNIESLTSMDSPTAPVENVKEDDSKNRIILISFSVAFIILLPLFGYLRRKIRKKNHKIEKDFTSIEEQDTREETASNESSTETKTKMDVIKNKSKQEVKSSTITEIDRHKSRQKSFDNWKEIYNPNDNQSNSTKIDSKKELKKKLRRNSSHSIIVNSNVKEIPTVTRAKSFDLGANKKSEKEDLIDLVSLKNENVADAKNDDKSKLKEEIDDGIVLNKSQFLMENHYSAPSVIQNSIYNNKNIVIRTPSFSKPRRSLSYSKIDEKIVEELSEDKKTQTRRLSVSNKELLTLLDNFEVDEDKKSQPKRSSSNKELLNSLDDFEVDEGKKAQSKRSSSNKELLNLLDNFNSNIEVSCSTSYKESLSSLSNCSISSRYLYSKSKNEKSTSSRSLFGLQCKNNESTPDKTDKLSDHDNASNIIHDIENEVESSMPSNKPQELLSPTEIDTKDKSKCKTPVKSKPQNESQNNEADNDIVIDPSRSSKKSQESPSPTREDTRDESKCKASIKGKPQNMFRTNEGDDCKDSNGIVIDSHKSSDKSQDILPPTGQDTTEKSMRKSHKIRPESASKNDHRGDDCNNKIQHKKPIRRAAPSQRRTSTEKDHTVETKRPQRRPMCSNETQEKDHAAENKRHQRRPMCSNEAQEKDPIAENKKPHRRPMCSNQTQEKDHTAENKRHQRRPMCSNEAQEKDQLAKSSQNQRPQRRSVCSSETHKTKNRTEKATLSRDKTITSNTPEPKSKESSQKPQRRDPSRSTNANVSNKDDRKDKTPNATAAIVPSNNLEPKSKEISHKTQRREPSKSANANMSNKDDKKDETPAIRAEKVASNKTDPKSKEVTHKLQRRLSSKSINANLSNADYRKDKTPIATAAIVPSINSEPKSKETSHKTQGEPATNTSNKDDKKDETPAIIRAENVSSNKTDPKSKEVTHKLQRRLSSESINANLSNTDDRKDKTPITTAAIVPPINSEAKSKETSHKTQREPATNMSNKDDKKDETPVIRAEKVSSNKTDPKSKERTHKPQRRLSSKSINTNVSNTINKMEKTTPSNDLEPKSKEVSHKPQRKELSKSDNKAERSIAKKLMKPSKDSKPKSKFCLINQ